MFNFLAPKAAAKSDDAPSLSPSPAISETEAKARSAGGKRTRSRFGSRTITPDDARAAAEIVNSSLDEDEDGNDNDGNEDDVPIVDGRPLLPHSSARAPRIQPGEFDAAPLLVYAREKWRSATHDERRRCITSSLVVAMCCVLLIVLPTMYAVGAARTIRLLDHDGARRSVWQQYALAIERAQDRSVPACASLYDHSCGALLAHMGNSTVYLGPFADMREKIEASLLQISEAGWPLIGTWFAACTDQTQRRAAGIAAVQPLLDAIAAVRDMDTLGAALAQLHAANVRALFSVYSSLDELDQYAQTLYVDAPPVLPPNLTLAPYAALFAPYMSADELRAAQQFEQTQLAPYIMSAAQRRQAFIELTDYNVVFLDGRVDYGHLTPAGLFGWGAYFARLLSVIDNDGGPAIAMTDLDRLVAVQAGYMQQLARLMVDWTRPPGGGTAPIWPTLRAYLRYRLVLTLAADLPPPQSIDANADADNSTMAEQCLSSVEQWLGELLGHYYAASQFPADSRAQVNAMVEGVVSAMEWRLQGHYAMDTSFASVPRPFMDNSTLDEALRKLRDLVPLVGYPDQWDTTPLAFAIDERQHLLNVLAASRDAVAVNVRAAWAPVSQLSSKTHWLMDAYEVNAYYAAETIVFPAGILQGPFFHPLAPLELNYGGLGVVIAHEVVHAFDDTGRLYDADGQRRNWFSNASLLAYQSRAQCIRTMYSQFKTPYGMIDGSLTLGENIADLGGVGVALQAYETAFRLQFDTPRKQAEYEQSLRRVFGADLTRHKLFFAAYASSWCSHVPPSAAATLLRTDPHSPPKWRVNGAATQSPLFSQVYGCRLPGKHCELY
jgi:predicted metalloendopeptidase